MVVFTTVLVMFAPLRRSTQSSAPREAGWMPLVVGSGDLIDHGAFHSLEHAPCRHQASASPLLRRLQDADTPQP